LDIFLYRVSLMRILLMLLILFVPLDACCMFYVCISYILYFVCDIQNK